MSPIWESDKVEESPLCEKMQKLDQETGFRILRRGEGTLNHMGKTNTRLLLHHVLRTKKNKLQKQPWKRNDMYVGGWLTDLWTTIWRKKNKAVSVCSPPPQEELPRPHRQLQPRQRRRPWQCFDQDGFQDDSGEERESPCHHWQWRCLWLGSYGVLSAIM